MRDEYQIRAAKKDEVLSRFSENFRKKYYDRNPLAHRVVDCLVNDIRPEQLLEELIAIDSQRTKIMEDLIERMPAPPIIITKEHWEEVQKTFVDTPKGKMWFDADAHRNEKQWMEDKMNGKHDKD